MKVIEDRFGPFGRLFTTLIVVSLGLGIVAWAYGLVATMWIDPLVFKLIPLLSYAANTLDLYFTIRLAIYLLVCMVAVAIWRWLLHRSYKQEIADRQQEVERLRKLLDEAGIPHDSD